MAYLWCNLFCALLWAVAASARHFSVVGYDPEDLRSEERLSDLFNLWCSRHGKLYEKGEEISKRFQIFKRNLEHIDAHNKLNTSSHWLGLNKFADLTNEEFKALYSGKILKPGKRWVDPHSGSPGHTTGSKAASCDAPSSIDWRKKGAVTGVKNQGDCGSCWSFSVTGAIEGINAISTGDLISLSEQELMDCDTTNYGCDGGYMNYAFEWVIQNGGIDTESDYPYTGTDGSCNTVKSERKVVTIDGYTVVADEDSALLCAVANQPVSVGIDASSLDFQLYTGGIYDGDCSNDPDDIDHAVLIVGYSSEDGEDYWIVKNSWGTDWGLNGYIYIRRNTGIINGVCAINSMASYPTKGETSPSPLPSPAVPPPPPPPPSPPPPGPSPVDCGDFSYCSSQETCCCIFQWGQYCLVAGCCELQNAVCCTDSVYCCPADYPICDLQDGLCLKNTGDHVGVEMKKRKRAHYKFPWKKHVDEENKSGDLYARNLRWRNHAAQ